nr:hypothetical protein CFP56_65238 [Quercus suber]
MNRRPSVGSVRIPTRGQAQPGRVGSVVFKSWRDHGAVSGGRCSRRKSAGGPRVLEGWELDRVSDTAEGNERGVGRGCARARARKGKDWRGSVERFEVTRTDGGMDGAVARPCDVRGDEDW